MRRFAFLAISLVLLVAAVIPARATPRSQELVEYRGSRERDAGASGDDDVPSKQELLRQDELPSTSFSLAGREKSEVSFGVRVRVLWSKCVQRLTYKNTLVSR